MKTLLTIEEATKLSVKTLYTYAEREKIPHIKLGRRVLFSEDKLEDWINRYSVEPGSQFHKGRICFCNLLIFIVYIIGCDI